MIFDDPAFALALTHRSYAYEQGGGHNERLELLGDAVLQLCVTEMLLAAWPEEDEGALSAMRSRLVNTKVLSRVARRHGLGERARLGRGEELSGGRTRPRLLAGIYEAVLAVVYERDGLDGARARVREDLAGQLHVAATTANPKTTLQEWCQRTHGTTPAYETVATVGPPHARTFTVEVRVAGEVKGSGTGPSKQDATVEAAEDALHALGLR